MQMKSEYKTDFPIFSACSFKSYLIISGGGGGQKFGLCNNISVLSFIDFSTAQKTNTEDDLFEYIYSNEVEDFVLALSENKIVLFKMDGKGNLERKSEVTIEIEKGDEIVSSYCNKKVLIGKKNKLEVYNIEKESITKEFEIEIEKPIKKIIGVEQSNNFFIVFRDKIMAFSIVNKKFVNELDLDCKGKSVYLSEQTDKGKLYAVSSNYDGTWLTVFERINESFSRYKQVGSDKINKERTTAVNVFGDHLVTANIEGFLEIFSLKEQTPRSVYKRKKHILPVKNLIVKNLPSTSKESGLLVMSFGADSMVKATMVNQQQLAGKNSQIQAYLIIAILVLILSYILRNQIG